MSKIVCLINMLPLKIYLHFLIKCEYFIVKWSESGLISCSILKGNTDVKIAKFM